MVALWASFVGPIPVAMQQMIDYLFARAVFYAQEVTRLNLMDEYLFDIPLAEYLYHREYRPRTQQLRGALVARRGLQMAVKPHSHSHQRCGAGK